jgi:hypothetical protein
LEHEDVYIVKVGNKELSLEHPKIIVAKNLTDNIETEEKLLTFTAWYAMSKHPMSYDYYCLLEYDCEVKDMPLLKQQLESSCGNFPVVSLGLDDAWNFYTDINPDYLHTYLRSKNIQKNYPINFYWPSTTNKCLRNDILDAFVDWYFPTCLYFKKTDFYNYSYYHERVFAVYLDHHQIKCCTIHDPNVRHQQCFSHSYHRSLPVDDFDWEFYTATYPEVVQSNPRVDGTRHFILHGYGEGRRYKKEPKKYFLTYDDESGRYDFSRLVESVKKVSDFEVVVFKKSSLESEFVEKHKNVLSMRRGGGYWLWKPYIISKMLQTVEEGSILFYIDSLYSFQNSFDDWLKLVDKNDIVVWKNKPNEPVYNMYSWCKMDVVDAFSLPDFEICWAGALLFKNTLYSRKIVEEWLRLCCDPHFLTDSPSKLPNKSVFVEHRHDQALLSVALYHFSVPLHYMDNTNLLNHRLL